ncbi:MAG TPA: hypothetical protein VK858_02230 [Longimicrobiales bacterium]|nr:hypothetical protein [Longimicrobiales bacterium]
MTKSPLLVVPRRSLWLQLGTWFGGLLLGPWVALRLGAALAPGSDLVQLGSVFGFAGIFAGGLLLWMGIGVLTVVIAGIRQLVRGRRPGVQGLGASEALVPRGYRSFFVLGVLLGAGTGFLAGVFGAPSIATGLLAWGLAGTAYGALLWAAAHQGYLPFPEPE